MLIVNDCTGAGNGLCQTLTRLACCGAQTLVGGGASVGGIKKKRGPRDKQAHGQNTASTQGMWNLRYNSGPPGVAPTLTKLPSVGIC